jgi:hypothetical protein
VSDKKRIISPNKFGKKPFWFNAVNRTWGACYPIGAQPSLDRDNLIITAKKITGLDDFGKDFWVEPLDRMLESIREEAQLSPIGYFITRQRVLNLLAVRLRAEFWFKKHPEILEEPLYPVILIAGLQRTGTTKLQRLLAADPDNRVLLSWEAINPVPLKEKIQTKEPRIRIARTSEKALRLMAPGFFAIHPVEHQAPEEDILLLDVTFLSTTAEATMHVPSYAQWLEKTDQSYAYEYGVKLLKILQWQRPGKRWVLKSPHHLEFLPLAKKHFEDVRFLWTHRNVYESIPSFLSMMAHSYSIFSDKTTKKMVSDHWVRKTGHLLSKALEFRNRDDNEAGFLDIFYEDLVNKSMEVLEKIYEQYGGIDQELRETFASAEKANPQGKYGMHRYGLADFGLGEEDIDGHTAEYQDMVRRLAGSMPVLVYGNRYPYDKR